MTKWTITYLSYMGSRLQRIRFHVLWDTKEQASRYAEQSFSEAERPKVVRTKEG